MKRGSIMKVRIGAIGPEDSLKLIREVAFQEPRIELVEFEYSSSNQLPEILNKHRYEVTQWIFSGQTPYHYCIDKGLITSEEASYPPLHGLALLGTCLQAMQENNRFIQKMSLDTVNEKIVQSLFSEYHLEKVSFELFPYEGYTDHEKLIDFHVKSYQAGKAEVALTCLVTVYLELTRLGIPCYRVKPSKLAIETILDLLISRAESHLYEKQRVAILGFEVFQKENSSKKMGYSFLEREKELELKQELLQLSKKLNGSLINKGSGVHFIYTTQGDYELLFSNTLISQVAQEITMRTGLNFHIGIGSGYTIYDAELHVQTAFEHAFLTNQSQVLYVDEDGVITDLTNSSDSAVGKVDQLPEYWSKVLKEHNYKMTVPSKIYHYMKMKNVPYFTSDFTTGLLKNSNRNSRRILNELEQMGLIRTVKEEKNSGKRGRPKKLYELVIEEENRYERQQIKF